MVTTTNLHSATLHINVKPRLEELIEQAECLQMAVAYWTIPENYFGNNLIELLKKTESFACVDISSPTDIDELCKLANRECNLYFYTKSLAKDTGKKKEGKNLLHSKVLLFDLPNNLASIWIGSHNWTDRALSGKNIETSLELSVDKDSDIYTKVKDLLGQIKADCHEVISDSDHERIYKITQKQEDSLLYLRSSITEVPELPLISKPFIHLILDNAKPDLTSFPNKKKIVFLIKSLLSSKHFLLLGQVFKNGELPTLVKGSNFPNLENGYYCLRENKNVSNFNSKPIKELVSDLTTGNRTNFCYYVTFKINDVQEIHDNDIDSKVFSKYETPITLLNELTQLEFREYGWQQSESFELKKDDKAVSECLDIIRNPNEIENIYENDYQESILSLLDKLRSQPSFRVEGDSKLDAILKVISLSKRTILIKEQLVNDTDIKKNKISRIPRAIISKVVAK